MASATHELSSRFELAAAAIFVAFSGGFVGIAATYPPTDRLLPLVVGVPTFLLSVLVFLSSVSPTVRSSIDRFSFEAFESAGELADDDEPTLSSNPYSEPIAWSLLLFGASLLFGLALVSPIFIYLFITRYGGKSRKAAALVGIASTVVFVILFEFVLGSPLYIGLVTEWLLDLIG